MLAQNFKTPADLGIKDVEFEALVKVLGMLERGEVRHVTVDESFIRSRPGREFRGLFNMSNIWANADCGTAACIAGTSDWICGTKFVERSYGDAHLRPGLPATLINLFCPPEVPTEDWDKITVEQSAIALRNYLSSGEPRWEEATAA